MKFTICSCVLLVFICWARPTQAQQADAGEGQRFSVTRDVVYARYGEREVKLDLYLPKEPLATPTPCIFVIHGGGWRSGNKERFARFATRLAEEGFAAACIDYRLVPEVSVLECVQDCKAAVRWVRANAEKHGIDPNRLGAIGGSAGGHLTAMLATSRKMKELEGLGGNANVSTRIQAAVGMATPADMRRFNRYANLSEAKLALISPITHIDADSAPLLLIHSKTDGTVPFAQSEQLEKKYREVGVDVQLVEIPEAPHAFWNGPNWFDDTMSRAVAFFVKKLK